MPNGSDGHTDAVPEGDGQPQSENKKRKTSPDYVNQMDVSIYQFWPWRRHGFSIIAIDMLN